MTVDEVIERVNQIASLAYDPEAAHSKEDSLFRDVLEEVAKGVWNGRDLAGAALKSRELEFDRWCA